MKHTHFAAAILLTVLLAATALPADDPNLLDLDGRELIARVYKDRQARRSELYEKIKVRVRNRTIAPELKDANESASLWLFAEDQTDELLRQYVDRLSGWAWPWKDGPQFYLPLSRPELEGREIQVRVYENCWHYPAAFELAPLKVKDCKLRFDFEALDTSGFVALFPEDQNDQTISRLIGQRIFAWLYRKKGLEFSLPRHPPVPAEHYSWTFVDALGYPLPESHVTIFLSEVQSDARIYIGAAKLDNQGRLNLPFIAGRASAEVRERIGTHCYNSASLCFEVSHPNDGRVATTKLCGHKKQENGSRTVFLPLVPLRSQADERSIWGTVLDPNGSPVAGALIECPRVIITGSKRIHPPADQVQGVFTDEQGRFRMYLALADDVYEIGTLIPPKAEYYVHIRPPHDSGLAPFKGNIVNGQQTTITLKHLGFYRALVFEDENGPITNPKVLKEITVFIRTAGQTGKIRLGYDQFKDGGTFPLGTYDAWLSVDKFEPMRVSEDSPEQLIFRFPPTTTYYGRVLDGTTGEPRPGVTVEGIGPDPVHTDDTGWFEIAVGPKSAARNILTVSNDNSLMVRVTEKMMKQDGQGKYAVQDVKLFPAATLKIHPVAKVETTRRAIFFRPQWHIYDVASPAWAQDLATACRGHPQEGVYSDFDVRAGKDNSFPVPASVNLRIDLRAHSDYGWAPITILDRIRLQPGELRDLGKVEIVGPFSIFVEVLNAAGSPVEGVPIIACGDWDPVISSTDEHGFAFFDFVGYSKGEFIVESHPEDNSGPPPLRQTIPYEVAGPEDANTVYTIQLSDKMLESLFR
ncbi:MAG TPA: hypothetical protein VMX13_01985 [Sedimentisphaerales bacterium]|nr:hypothetical protein [Sedimentisphaerales bacterium]